LLAPLTHPSPYSAKIELIDLRTILILPGDIETVLKSIPRTRRLAILHEAGMTGGFRGEIVAEAVGRIKG
jgi:pyruvate/2-oxoglutarate/acetoin dehydrogenase E1 component